MSKQPKVWKKYDLHPTTPVLSPKDEHQLAKLVERYGTNAIISAAPHAKLRKRGRPQLGMQPVYEKADSSSWIDQRAAEHKRSGKKAPIKKARCDYFEMETGNDRPTDTEIATIKKKHLEGRKIRKRWGET